VPDRGRATPSRVDEPLLLVEDDPSLREMTQLGLAPAGFVVSTAGDGAHALERVLADPPDLVVLDLMLPTLDGLEVYRRIRARLQIPIVIVTARSDPTDVVVGLELGADDYVTKPFDLPVLVARCRAVLRRRTVPETTGTLRVGDLEVDTGDVKDYPTDGVPVLVILELDAQHHRCRYQLLVPGNDGHGQMLALIDSLPSVAKGLSRVLTTLDEVELRWPGCRLRSPRPGP